MENFEKGLQLGKFIAKHIGWISTMCFTAFLTVVVYSYSIGATKQRIDSELERLDNQIKHFYTVEDKRDVGLKTELNEIRHDIKIILQKIGRIEGILDTDDKP